MANISWALAGSKTCIGGENINTAMRAESGNRAVILNNHSFQA
jgi:hypothetical protein